MADESTIQMLSDELVMTRNDLAMAHRRISSLEAQLAKALASNSQESESPITNGRPSLEEIKSDIERYASADAEEVRANSSDNSDTTSTGTGGCDNESQQRIRELEEEVAQLKQDLAEKDRIYAENMRKKDEEIMALQQKNACLEQKVANLTTQTKVGNKNQFGSKADQIKDGVNGLDPDDRRVQEESFNGKFVEDLNQEEKDNLDRARIKHEMKKRANRSKEKEDKLVEELKNEGRDVRSVSEIVNETKRKRLSEIDYSKSEEEVKAQIMAVLCPGTDPENVEIRLFNGTDDIPQGARLIRRNGQPDFSYYMVAERIPAQTKFIIIQQVRVQEGTEPAQSDVVPDVASSEGVTPSEAKTASDSESTSSECDSTPQEDKTCSEAESTPAVCDSTPQEEEESEKSRFKTISATPIDTHRGLGCCVFSNRLLSWILNEKYNHGSTFDDIIARLAEEGIGLNKVTFNENVHRAISRLKLGCETLFSNKIRLSSHLAVDETFMLVAVKEKVVGEDGKVKEVTVYRIRYLWCFLDYLEKVVCYVYEDGSRSQDVLTRTLIPEGCDRPNAMLKALMSDGYSAYNLFENLKKKDNPFIGEDGEPLVLHCGDWCHARRRACKMILESPKEGLLLINMIRELFVIEVFIANANLKPERVKEIRGKYAVPVINEIFQYSQELSEDPVLMARQYTSSAIKYILNQQTRLKNYVMDGQALITTNCVERMMKPVKKILKVSMFIGSEEAASNFAFMLSLTMTAKLKKINFLDYMEYLLEGLQDVPDLNKVGAEGFKKTVSSMAEPYMLWNYIKRC